MSSRELSKRNLVPGVQLTGELQNLEEEIARFRRAAISAIADDNREAAQALLAEMMQQQSVFGQLYDSGVYYHNLRYSGRADRGSPLNVYDYVVLDSRIYGPSVFLMIRNDELAALRDYHLHARGPLPDDHRVFLEPTYIGVEAIEFLASMLEDDVQVQKRYLSGARKTRDLRVERALMLAMQRSFVNTVRDEIKRYSQRALCRFIETRNRLGDIPFLQQLGNTVVASQPVTAGDLHFSVLKILECDRKETPDCVARAFEHVGTGPLPKPVGGVEYTNLLYQPFVFIQLSPRIGYRSSALGGAEPTERHEAGAYGKLRDAFRGVLSRLSHKHEGTAYLDGRFGLDVVAGDELCVSASDESLCYRPWRGVGDPRALARDPAQYELPAILARGLEALGEIEPFEGDALGFAFGFYQDYFRGLVDRVDSAIANVRKLFDPRYTPRAIRLAMPAEGS